MDIYPNAIIVQTSTLGKGGVVSYAKIKRQLQNKCLEDRAAFVTTMFDLFRLPNDFPGTSEAAVIRNPLERACRIEERMEQDLQQENFIANLIVHEFEGLLYSDPDSFADWFDDVAVQALHQQRNSCDSPEHINDGAETAPSKRIRKVCRAYDKPLHGAVIALGIGLDRMRAECQHFDAWLTRLSKLSGVRNM